MVVRGRVYKDLLSCDTPWAVEGVIKEASSILRWSPTFINSILWSSIMISLIIKIKWLVSSLSSFVKRSATLHTRNNSNVLKLLTMWSWSILCFFSMLLQPFTSINIQPTTKAFWGMVWDNNVLLLLLCVVSWIKSPRSLSRRLQPWTVWRSFWHF